jgi:predicted dehydrogenase
MCFHKDVTVAKEASINMKCNYSTSYEELLNSKDVQAVVLTVPNEFHFSYAKIALEAGKHVLVEKPLTNTLEDAEELIALALKKNLVLHVGHNYRKSGFIVKIKEELDKDRIGKIVAAEFNMGHGGALKFKSEQWRFHKEKCPGGPLNMLGTHLIDTANYLFGTPVEVTGHVQNLYADTTAEDMSLIQIKYQNSVIANITNLYNSVSTEFINIYGTEGALRFTRWPVAGLWFQGKDINCDSGPYERLEYAENNPQQEIFEAFIQEINSPDYNSQNSMDALTVVQLMSSVLKHQLRK